MSIVNKILGGVLLAGSLATTGCSLDFRDQGRAREAIDSQVKTLMNNKPHSEYEKATAHWRKHNLGVSDAQNTLDSIGYRKVFESTQGVNDSALVAEFNSIAASNRVKNSSNSYKLSDKVMKNIEQNVESESIADIEAVKKASAGDIGSAIAVKQHAADSIKYNNFFEKHNLLNDSVRNILNRVEEQISPRAVRYHNRVFLKFKK